MAFIDIFKRGQTIQNSKPTGRGGISGVQSVAAKLPNDAIATLTLEKIDTTYRREIETKGLFLNAAYSLDQMGKLVSPLAEVLNFWTSQISTLDWEVKTIAGADENKAEKQKAIVEARFNQFKNFKKAVKHLALFRIYGYGACKVYDDSLALIPFHAVAQNVMFNGSTPPTYDYYLNSDGQFSPDFNKLEKLIAPDFVIVESDNSILLALLRLALKWKEQDDKWDANLETASRNQIIVTTPPQSQLTEKQKSNLEQLLISLSEGNSGWLEELDPQSPIKIQRIEPPPALTLYKDRLASIKTDIISLIASSTLNNQTGATGLGSNVADAHMDTLKTLVIQDAVQLSEALDSAITIPILEKEGLIQMGETPLVYFRLSQRKENDANGAFDLAIKARAAGRDIEDEDLAEMTGLELKPYAIESPSNPFAPIAPVAQPMKSVEPHTEISAVSLNGAQVTSLVGVIAEVTGGRMPIESAKAIIEAAFPAITQDVLQSITKPLEGFEPKQLSTPTLENMETAPKDSKFLEDSELEKIDKNLLEAIENLTQKYVKDDTPIDEKWINDLQDAINALTPDLVDVSDIQAKLESEMLKAAKGAIVLKTSEMVLKNSKKGK